jgi:probable phosphoglycerate mutase
MNLPPRIYFIRHGETAWSLSGQHTGTTDLPLLEQGEQGARKLAPVLQAITFSHVFTSQRQRARHTCELAGLGAMAVIEPDLAEWNYGDYEGLRSPEIHATRPAWNIYHDGCPNGESPEQISARADRLILKLDAMEGNIALFSHGHFGRVLAARWIGLPVLAAQHFQLGTASVSILETEANHTPHRVIAQWNARPA